MSLMSPALADGFFTQSLLTLMSTESVMPSNHLIFCSGREGGSPAADAGAEVRGPLARGRPWECRRGLGPWTGRGPAEGVLGSVWFLYNRYTPYPNLYPDQSPSEDWTMEERFRPLTFHGLILRSQLVTLLVRGVCYSESQSVSLPSCPHQASGKHEGARNPVPTPAVEQCVQSPLP